MLFVLLPESLAFSILSLHVAGSDAVATLAEKRTLLCLHLCDLFSGRFHDFLNKQSRGCGGAGGGTGFDDGAEWSPGFA